MERFKVIFAGSDYLGRPRYLVIDTAADCAVSSPYYSKESAQERANDMNRNGR